MARLTKEQIVKIIDEQKNPLPKEWYKSNLTAKSYCETASREIIKITAETKQIPGVKQDDNCTYNPGNREDIRKTLNEALGEMSKLQGYIDHSNRHEERMCHCMFAQHFVGDYEVIDYQVRTANLGHDNIDLVLRKGDSIFITETKYFKSDETLLRCVLEIQTYYQKLNTNFCNKYSCSWDKVKKAVLVSNDTVAYAQREQPWARELLSAFDITLLTLSHDDSKYYISE